MKQMDIFGVTQREWEKSGRNMELRGGGALSDLHNTSIFRSLRLSKIFSISREISLKKRENPP